MECRYLSDFTCFAGCCFRSVEFQTRCFIGAMVLIQLIGTKFKLDSNNQMLKTAINQHSCSYFFIQHNLPLTKHYPNFCNLPSQHMSSSLGMKYHNHSLQKPYKRKKFVLTQHNAKSLNITLAMPPITTSSSLI
jgi:hypothetical protein